MKKEEKEKLLKKAGLSLDGAYSDDQLKKLKSFLDKGK
jgi:hypothetical protein